MSVTKWILGIFANWFIEILIFLWSNISFLSHPNCFYVINSFPFPNLFCDSLCFRFFVFFGCWVFFFFICDFSIFGGIICFFLFFTISFFFFFTISFFLFFTISSFCFIIFFFFCIFIFFLFFNWNLLSYVFWKIKFNWIIDKFWIFFYQVFYFFLLYILCSIILKI